MTDQNVLWRHSRSDLVRVCHTSLQFNKLLIAKARDNRRRDAEIPGSG